MYTAEKNRGLTLRLHFMLIAAWAVGALKTVSQGLYAYKECAPPGRRRPPAARPALPAPPSLNPPPHFFCSSGRTMVPQYAFLLSAQLVNLVNQAAAMRVLKSVARHDQVEHEKTKAWLHVLLDVAVMVCVILSDPTLPHSPVPLSTMIVTSFLAVLDMLRLDTLLRLHAINWMCFAFLEADRYMRVPGATPASVGVDVLYAVAFGTALPLAVAAVSEAYQREAFLRDCRKPMDTLGPFWSGVLGVLRRLPGLGAAPLPQEPHID